MKRLKSAVILLLGLSMATMMTSCNKESSYQDKIIGKWQVTKIIWYTYDLSGTLVDESVFNDIDDVYEFFSNGSVYANVEDGEIYTVSYVITGNTLSFIFGMPFEEHTILELTNSTMVWELESVDSDNNRKYVTRRELRKVN